MKVIAPNHKTGWQLRLQESEYGELDKPQVAFISKFAIGGKPFVGNDGYYYWEFYGQTGLMLAMEVGDYKMLTRET